MDEHPIHFEVFAKRAGSKAFSLELAMEDRERAVAAAEEMFERARFVAVKVTKETLDPETGLYRSATILTKGSPDTPQSKVPVEDPGPPCVSPTDLYTVHARDRIGRLLESWLVRNRATAFELLHRPDLIEKLEASGTELQHAIQKIAVPDAQARGVSTHAVIRGFQDLTQRAIDRVLADQRKGILPDLKKESFAAVCARLAGDPERHYLVGTAIAGHIAPATNWGEKVNRLLDLADAAPQDGQGRGLAFHLLEQPLGEILRTRMAMADLLGGDLDLGGNLAALTRLAAAAPVAALARMDATVARLLPPLSGPAERLAMWLDGPSFANVRVALGKRVVQELQTQRRLRPGDPHGEIEIMRALAMALTAASGQLLPLEDVRDAFIKRSETLVGADFVGAYLEEQRSAVQEAHDLIWLLENVTGGVNKRRALRWLLAAVGAQRFETELTTAADSAAARLARLADLHRQLIRTSSDAGADAVLQRIGEVGGRIEAEAKLVGALVRAPAPLPQKLKALIGMAAGETAPPGPAADRARNEVKKAMRTPEARAALNDMPDAMGKVRALMSLEAAA